MFTWHPQVALNAALHMYNFMSMSIEHGLREAKWTCGGNYFIFYMKILYMERGMERGMEGGMERGHGEVEWTSGGYY